MITALQIIGVIIVGIIVFGVILFIASIWQDGNDKK